MAVLAGSNSPRDRLDIRWEPAAPRVAGRWCSGVGRPLPQPSYRFVLAPPEAVRDWARSAVNCPPTRSLVSKRSPDGGLGGRIQSSGSLGHGATARSSRRSARPNNSLGTHLRRGAFSIRYARKRCRWCAYQLSGLDFWFSPMCSSATACSAGRSMDSGHVQGANHLRPSTAQWKRCSDMSKIVM